jgi:hypothetical protein
VIRRQFNLLKEDVGYIALYVGIPFLIFAVATPFIFFSRAIFIVDYALLCFMSLYVSKRTLGLLWICFVLLDILFSVAPTYHFGGVDFFRNTYAFVFMSWQTIALTGILLCIVMVVYFSCTRPFFSQSSTISPRSVFAVIAISLLLIGLDVLNGTNGFSQKRSWQIIDRNIAGSNLNKLAAEVVDIVTYRGATVVAKHKSVSGATSSLIRDRISGKAPIEDNILLVVVESMGVPLSEKLLHRYAEPFKRKALRERYEFLRGEIGFSGSTVPGEIRELCGTLIQSTTDVAKINFGECLPQLMKENGYQTTAMHGYSPYMFERNSWYVHLGFDHIYFADDIAAAGYFLKCGLIFRGSCDSDVANLIHRRLTQFNKEKKFIYWLTLNSHLPVARDTSLELDLDCMALLEAPDQEEHQDVCRLHRVLLGLMQSIADIAEKTDENLRVIIVGDHAPPFVLQRDRALFKPGVVQFIELVSKKRVGNVAQN